MWIRRRYKKWLWIGALLLLSLTLLLAGLTSWMEKRIVAEQAEQQEASSILPLVLKDDPLSVNDYTKAKVGIAPGKIYLVDNCTAVILTTSLSKTYSIQRALEGALDIRPDAYDTLYDMMAHYAIQVKLVKIFQLQSDLYYAQLFLEKDNQLLNLDAKPSDALAIATRFQVPVYVHNELFKKQGTKVC